jgi:hypothetical protein
MQAVGDPETRSIHSSRRLYLVVGPSQIDKHEFLLGLAVLEQFQHFRAADGRWFRLGFGVCGVPWLFDGRGGRWNLGGHDESGELMVKLECMVVNVVWT